MSGNEDGRYNTPPGGRSRNLAVAPKSPVTAPVAPKTDNQPEKGMNAFESLQASLSSAKEQAVKAEVNADQKAGPEVTLKAPTQATSVGIVTKAKGSSTTLKTGGINWGAYTRPDYSKPDTVPVTSTLFTTELSDLNARENARKKAAEAASSGAKTVATPSPASQAPTPATSAPEVTESSKTPVMPPASPGEVHVGRIDSDPDSDDEAKKTEGPAKPAEHKAAITKVPIPMLQDYEVAQKQVDDLVDCGDEKSAIMKHMTKWLLDGKGVTWEVESGRLIFSEGVMMNTAQDIKKFTDTWVEYWRKLNNYAKKGVDKYKKSKVAKTEAVAEGTSTQGKEKEEAAK